MLYQFLLFCFANFALSSHTYQITFLSYLVQPQKTLEDNNCYEATEANKSTYPKASIVTIRLISISGARYNEEGDRGNKYPNDIVLFLRTASSTTFPMQPNEFVVSCDQNVFDSDVRYEFETKESYNNFMRRMETEKQKAQSASRI